MVRYNPILEIGQNTSATYGITLYDVNERPYEGLDLTNAEQVLLTMEHKAWGETVVSEGVCEIPEETEEEGYVEYSFSAQETRYYGTHFIQFEIQYENGEVERVPPEGVDWTLFVGRRLPADSPLRASNAIIGSLTVGGGGPYSSLEGPGLYNDEGQLAVSISAEGVDGLTNPLIEHMDASGFDILNPRDVGKDTARVQNVYTQGLTAGSADAEELAVAGESLPDEADLPVAAFTYAGVTWWVGTEVTDAMADTDVLIDVGAGAGYESPDSGGSGGGVSNPLSEDLDSGGYSIVNVGSVRTDAAHIATQLDIPVFSDDTTAPTATHYFNDSDATLKYKDANGVVHAGSGGGGDVSNPMTEDLDVGGHAITNAGSVETDTAAVANGVTAGSVDTARADITASADIQINVPSDASTLNEAVELASGVVEPKNGVNVVVNIETGHALTTQTTVTNGHYGNITIQSEDATVPIDSASFASTDDVLFAKRCVAPVWDITVDMGGAGRDGIWGEMAWITVTSGSGVQNAGRHGCRAERSWVDIASSVFTGATEDGIYARGGTHCYAPHIDASGAGVHCAETTHATVATFRDSTLSNAGDDAVEVRRSYSVFDGATINGAGNRAMRLRNGCRVQAANVSIDNPTSAGIWATECWVEASGATISNCADGIRAWEGADVKVPTADISGTSGPAIDIRDGADATFNDATLATIGGNYEIGCFRGSTMSIHNTTLDGAAVDGTHLQGASLNSIDSDGIVFG